MKQNLMKLAAAMLAGVLSVGAAGSFDVHAEDETHIVVLGDSLSFGSGLEEGEKSYVELLGELPDTEVMNFSYDHMTTENMLHYMNDRQMQSYLDSADVIIVSVGIHDIMDPFMEKAQGYMDKWGFEKFEDVFLASLSEHGLTETDLQYYAADLTTAVKSNRETAKANMLEIGERLSAYNDAQIIFQNVYNPIDTIENLEKLSDKRKMAYTSICHIVNTALNDSVNAAVGELSETYGYEIADVQTPFLGNAYRYVHLNELDVNPTAQGHAVIAEVLTDMVVRKLGDVTGDGEINAQDAAAVLVYASEIGAGLEGSLNEAALQAGDVDGVDGVNAADAAKILAYAAQLSAGGNPSWD